MTIAYRSVSRTTDVTHTSTALTLDRPTGVALNDALFACLLTYHETVDPVIEEVPAGWTLVDTVFQGRLRMWVYRRRGAASEPATYTWTRDSSAEVEFTGAVIAFTGVRSNDPVDTKLATGGSHLFGLQYPALNNAMGLYFYAAWTSGKNYTDVTYDWGGNPLFNGTPPVVRTGDNIVDADMIFEVLTSDPIATPATRPSGSAMPTGPGTAGSPADANVIEIYLAPGILPAITAVTPDHGPKTGGETIVVTGTDLKASTSSITIGGVACTGVTFVNATTLRAITPANTAGDHDVVVTDADGESEAF